LVCIVRTETDELRACVSWLDKGVGPRELKSIIKEANRELLRECPVARERRDDEGHSDKAKDGSGGPPD
jgi:hypothetical protein